jgi:hypothetical protein
VGPDLIIGWPHYYLKERLVPHLDTFTHSSLQCASLVGVAAITERDVKQGSWYMSWYFLVKWCATIPIEGVEEDLFFILWYTYIEEVFFGFSTP